MLERTAFALTLFILAFTASSAAGAKTVRLAIGEWAPFVSEAEPGYGSYTQDLTRFLSEVGLEPRYHFHPWRRSLELVRVGESVATFPWSYTNDRAEDFLYPEHPIGRLNDVMFFKADRFPDGLPAKTLEDLKSGNLRVVGISGYWYQEILADMGVSFFEVSYEEEAWKMLRHGRADVFIENDIVGRKTVRKFLGDDAGLIAESKPFRTVPVYVLFSKQHPMGAHLKDLWDRTMPEASGH